MPLALIHSLGTCFTRPATFCTGVSDIVTQYGSFAFLMAVTITPVFPSMEILIACLPNLKASPISVIDDI